jgi:hypothetical protein
MATSYIRGSGTGQYTSLSGWESGVDTSNSPETAIIDEAFIDTTSVTINIANRSATNTTEIYTSGDALPTGKRINETTPDGYLLKTTGDAILIASDYTTIRGLTFKAGTTTGAYWCAIELSGADYTTCLAEECIAFDNLSTTYGDFLNIPAHNCASIGGNTYGFRYNNNTHDMVNNLVLNSAKGFGVSSGYTTGTIWTNCVVKHTDAPPNVGFYRGDGDSSRANASSSTDIRGDQSHASVEFLSQGDTPTGDYVAYKSVVAGSEDISAVIDLGHGTYNNVLIDGGVTAYRDASGYNAYSAPKTTDFFGVTRHATTPTMGPVEYVDPATSDITHGTTSTAVDAGASSTTISSFVVSGSDPCLVVKVALKSSSVTCTGVTFNTTENFTLVDTDINGDARVYMYVLAAPTVTTADVVVSLSGSARHVSAVSLYNGVDQTTPIRTGSTVKANGTDAAPTVNVTTSTAGDLLIDSLAQVSAGPDTATGDWTERHDTAATGGGTDTRGASQDTPSGGSTYAMAYTMSDSDNWAIVACALAPVAASDTGYKNLLLLGVG